MKRLMMISLTCIMVFSTANILCAMSKTPPPPESSEAPPTVTELADPPDLPPDPWLRKCFFGDLHVHTELSSDAFGEGTRTTLDEAYEFARGGEIDLPPYCDGSDPDCVQRTLKLDRPLDFVAITDHAEFLGEQDICRDENAKGYNSIRCKNYRKNTQLSFLLWNSRLSKKPIGNATTIDRFLIFRSGNVPARPISYFDAPKTEWLWSMLEEECAPLIVSLSLFLTIPI